MLLFGCMLHRYWIKINKNILATMIFFTNVVIRMELDPQFGSRGNLISAPAPQHCYSSNTCFCGANTKPGPILLFTQPLK